MGTKTVTTTKTVRTCDGCGREIDHAQTCQICRRECCYSCRSFICLHDGSPGLIDVGFNVCSDCKVAGEDVCGVAYRDLMRAAVKEADAVLMKLLTRWREWAKEREENAQPSSDA